MVKETVNKGSSARPCPACGANTYRERGFKGTFEMVSCRGCNTLYTAHIPDAESAEDYNHYYHDENLNLPDFILRRLDEVITGFSIYRVESGYQLNEALMASPSRRLLKDALNGLLNVGRLGDTLKIWAEK